MPQYKFDYKGKKYKFTSPTEPTREEILLAIGETEPLSEKPIIENPEQQAQITEESLYEDPEWIEASKSIYFWDQGDDAPKLETDEEYAKFGLNYMGQFNYNLFETGQEALQLSDATDEQKKDFVTLMDKYDRKAATWAGAGRFAKGVFTDPSTYLGAGIAGRIVGQGVKQTLKNSIRENVKQAVKDPLKKQALKDIKKEALKKGTLEGFKQGSKIGSLEGSIYAGLDNTFRQNAKINAGVQQDFDWEELGKSSALGAGIGLGLGGLFGGVASNIGARTKFSKILKDEEKSLQNPDISKKDIEVKDKEINEKIIDEKEPRQPDIENKPTIKERLEEQVEPLPDIQIRKQEAEAGLLGKTYQNFAGKVLDGIKKPFIKFSTFKDLPEVEKFLTFKGLTGGRLEKVKTVTRDVYDLFEPLDSATNQTVRKYLIGEKGAESIKDINVRNQAKELREAIDFIGDSLVKRNILPKDVVDKNKETYLPRMYLKFLDKKGRMDYTKTRKDLDDATKEFLGEVHDVSLQGPKAIEEPMSDIIKFSLFEKIIENPNWAFRPGLVSFRGKEVSPVWLAEEKNRIAEETLKGPRSKESGERLVNEMQEAIDEAEINISKTDLSAYKQVPDSKQYGSLRGAYIRKEIYNDLIESQEFANPDSGWLQAILGPQGYLTKLTRFWKMTKVALNPPTQVRNFLANGVLMNLSGVKWKDLGNRYIQALDDIRKDGPFYQIAKKYGVTNTTYNKQEMFEINQAYLKIKQKDIKNPIEKVKYIGAVIADTASNAYQFTEVLGKTAKIIDAMSKGADEATAVLAAQKTLFDYSSVPALVRYLRNAPVGVPFLTFYYKVLPNLLETAIRYPERYIPYVAIPFGMAKIVEQYQDITSEDVEVIKELMPKFVKDNGSAFILPVKDENDNWQVFDFSYLLPWSMYTGLIRDAAEGEMAEAFGRTGILGGPVPEAITALRANKDAFTGQDIINENDPPNIQLRDSLLYLWRLAGPPFLTDRGWLGKISQAVNKDVDKFGDPKITKTQAMLRLVGINLYPIDVTKSRRYNILNMQREIQDIKSRRNRVLKDPNLTKEEIANLKNQYDERLKYRIEQLKDFKKETKLSEKIK